MALPLCPCNSGKLYENCCYKIKGEDGEPLFFKGMMTGDDKGNWHPLPNVRIDATLVGRTDDKYRDFAKNLADNSKLKSKHHLAFIDAFAIFFYSYEKLLAALTQSHGQGVAFQMDSLEVRYHWKQFLFNGRCLVNFIGLYCRGTLGLDEKIGKLNADQFEFLLRKLQKLGERDAGFLAVKEDANSYKEDILEFIAMRNREKDFADTIVKFPAIDDEFGVKNDGELILNGKVIPMIQFVETSYKSILSLAKVLLKIST